MTENKGRKNFFFLGPSRIHIKHHSKHEKHKKETKDGCNKSALSFGAIFAAPRDVV